MRAFDPAGHALLHTLQLEARQQRDVLRGQPSPDSGMTRDRQSNRRPLSQHADPAGWPRTEIRDAPRNEAATPPALPARLA